MTLNDYLVPERPLDEPEYDGPVCDSCGCELMDGERYAVLDGGQLYCEDCLKDYLKDMISDDPFGFAGQVGIDTQCINLRKAV